MGKEKRGFASASPERLKEISLKGSDAALKSAHRHKWTSKEGREAHLKGLVVRHQHRAERLRVSKDKKRWMEIWVSGQTYYVVQLQTRFTMDEKAYPEGSWLVQLKDAPEPNYARPMLNDDFQVWKSA